MGVLPLLPGKSDGSESATLTDELEEPPTYYSLPKSNEELGSGLRFCNSKALASRFNNSTVASDKESQIASLTLSLSAELVRPTLPANSCLTSY